MIRRSLLAFACVLVTSTAAAEPTAIEKSTADALFKEGKALMAKKEFDTACPKLAESHRLQPGGGVILALAFCYEGQGRLASSLSAYREALALALRDKRKDREDTARPKIAELEARVSTLTVVAQGMSITLDGVALPSASLGTAIPMDGGTHVVEASASGKVSRKIEVTLGNEKDKKEVTVPALEGVAIAAPDKKAKEPAPPPPAPRPEETRSVVPWVIGGVGLVALGIGGYYGVSAISKRRDVADACPGNVCTDPAMVDRNDEAKSAATVSNVAIGVGAVALGTAIVWMVLDTPKKEAPHVTAAVGPKGASLGLEVSW